jgi:hypothetical protein
MPTEIELTTTSTAVKKRILSLLAGVNRPITRTAAEGAPHSGIVADTRGQLCRVGPFALTAPRTIAYDWYVADTDTSWRKVMEPIDDFVAQLAVLNTRGRFTAAATAPSSPAPASNDEWFETTTGSRFLFFDGYWVEQIARAEFPNATVTHVNTLSETLTAAHTNGYLRYESSGTKILNVPASSIQAFQVGSVATIRNASLAGSVTMTPSTTVGNVVTINCITNGLIIPPNTSTQIMYVGSNTWDVL